MKHRTWMLKYGPTFFFDADKGTNGGAPANGTDPGKKDDDDKSDPDGKKTDEPEEKKFTQKDLDAIIADRLKREEVKREATAKKVREQAEEEALVKNQEFQKLADERAKRIAELEPRVGEIEPLKEQVTRYKEALEKYLEAEKKDLPKHVLTLLEKLDPIEQMTFISENREELGKPAKTVDPIPPSPNPKERKLSDDDKSRAQKEQGSIYSRF
jgi:hypothetical protein